MANLKNTLSVTITWYQPNYYILTTAQKLGIKVLQGTYNDAIPSLAAPSGFDREFLRRSADRALRLQVCRRHNRRRLRNHYAMDRTKFCTGGPYIEPVNNVNPANPAVQLIKNGTIIGIRIGNEAMNAMVDKVPITPTALSDAARALRKALDARGFTTRCRS